MGLTAADLHAISNLKLTTPWLSEGGMPIGLKYTNLDIIPTPQLSDNVLANEVAMAQRKYKQKKSKVERARNSMKSHKNARSGGRDLAIIIELQSISEKIDRLIDIWTK